MAMNLPDFAKPIVDARERGMRPAEMVIVSDGDHALHRRFPANPVVRIRPEQRPSSLSWRFLAGLDVEIATEHTNRQQVYDLILAVGRAEPRYLGVWNVLTDGVTPILYDGLHMLFHPFTDRRSA